MIKRRNMVMQVLLYIVTLGIYGIYWFYVTAKEMIEYKKLDGNPGLWTFLLFIPIANWYAIWKYSDTLEKVTDGKYNALLMLILWFIFTPIVWIITQSELNKLATQDA